MSNKPATMRVRADQLAGLRGSDDSKEAVIYRVIVDACRAARAKERRAIVRFLAERKHADESPTALAAAIKRGAHHSNRAK